MPYGGVFSCSTEGEQPLAAGTAERVLWLMGATTTKGRIIEWGVAFQGVGATDGPVEVKVFRCTNAGTTPTATTEVVWDKDNAAAQLIAVKAWGTEPTRDTNPLMHTYVHPQSGIVMQYPLGREIVVDADTANGITIECNAPQAVDCVAYFVWEE
jgi:hypothetical protein